MNYKVVIGTQAEKDIKDIYNYISFELCDPVSAAQQIKRITERILALDSLPERHRKYSTGMWNMKNLRVMPVDKYLVFYDIDIETLTVTASRILYSGRDIKTLLKREN